MHPKFRKLVLATATVIAVAATTVALPGSAEARCCWRGGAWGCGCRYSYPAYSYGFIATDILSDILALTMDGTLATITPIVGPTMDMPAIGIVDRPTSLFRVRSTV